ncbi:MAG: hypothetical protein PHF36_03045 [Candidatus Cloacimonetes bacterium]|nr:hypothetical protein [Candidatus Cloacimonadota bacterium]MDD3501956.1 hypothetical protein [Candidatus Cloacimonadota bacterium]
MDSKTDKLVNQFLESSNMDYLFLILANLEVNRLSNLPDGIKKNFDKKISDMAMKHTAINDIPDFILDYVEGEEEVSVRNMFAYDDDDDDDDDDLVLNENYQPETDEYLDEQPTPPRRVSYDDDDEFDDDFDDDEDDDFDDDEDDDFDDDEDDDFDV